MNKALIQGPMTKVLTVTTRAPEPSADQLAKIKPYLLREFSADDLYVRQMMLANDQVDRSFERFDEGYLRRFAETIIGKSVLEGHDYGTVPVGRFFDADVTQEANGWKWVAPWFYTPKSDGNQLLRDSIDAGVYSYVSIGCYVDWAGLVCDICGQSYYGDDDETAPRCPHFKGESYDGKTCTVTFTSARSDMNKVYAVEGSIVYLGCQYDAAIAKCSKEAEDLKTLKISRLADDKPPQGEQSTEDTVMPTVQELRDQNPELAKAMTDLESDKAAAEAKAADLEKQAGDLKPLAEAGTKLLEDLKTEIKRLGGCLKLGETTIEAVTATDDVEKLLAVKAEYEKTWADKAAESGRGKPDGDDEDADTKATRPTDARAFSTI